MGLIKKYFLLFGMLFVCSTVCESQHCEKYSDNYLIVIDVQPQFYSKKKFDVEATEMIRNINALIGKFAPENVIYLQAAGKVLSLSSKGFKVDTLFPELDSALKIVSQHILGKFSGDAFEMPELIKLLENRQDTEIFLVGLMAEKCVYQTAIGGKDLGFNVVLVSDGIMGRTPKKKEEALSKLEEAGIFICR